MGKKLLKKVQNIFKSISMILSEFGKAAGYALSH